ncbi:MAG TPA: hypothetical protein PLM08_19445, partial [Polyangiaceae bacterium]|nr:hypothetical protein [Polyangiaceae bacterium]
FSLWELRARELLGHDPIRQIIRGLRSRPRESAPRQTQSILVISYNHASVALTAQAVRFLRLHRIA